MVIGTRYTSVQEAVLGDNKLNPCKVNKIKSSLIYEDGEGARRKGYYIYTVPCFTDVTGCTLLNKKFGIEKLLVNLDGKRNGRAIKQEAETMFETEADNLEKYLISTLFLIKN